jgi:predicted acetyltransferase
MSPVELRAPTDDDRESIALCLSRSLNTPRERALARATRLPIEDFRCVFDGDRVVATAGEFHFVQWFGGRALPCSGIFGVSTLPEYRGRGLATLAMRDLLTGARARGEPLTALFPAVLGPYRRLGYELAGTYQQYRVPIDSLPVESDPSDLPEVVEVDGERDVRGVADAYREFVRHENGPVEPTQDRWWTRRVFDFEGDEKRHGVVARAGDVVQGFAAFAREDDPGLLHIAFGVACEPLVATTPGAMRALLSYFHGYRGLGRWLEWTGRPQDPFALLIAEQDAAVHWRFHWMLRLLDVAGALQARGYPSIDAEAIIAIDDPNDPENAGPWRLTVERGSPRVERVDGPAPRPIPIGTLAALFSGFLKPHDAVRIGALESGDPAVEALAALLSGTDQWMPFFF